MTSAIIPTPIRTSNAVTSVHSFGDTKIPTFTRRTSAESSKPVFRSEASKVKDRGSIDPAAVLYGQIQSTVQSILVSGIFNNGTHMSGTIDLGATPVHPMGTYVVEAQGVGNEIHTDIYENGVPVHNVRFAPSGNGNARIILNGQVLTSNSAPNDL